MSGFWMGGNGHGEIGEQKQKGRLQKRGGSNFRGKTGGRVGDSTFGHETASADYGGGEGGVLLANKAGTTEEK